MQQSWVAFALLAGAIIVSFFISLILSKTHAQERAVFVAFGSLMVIVCACLFLVVSRSQLYLVPYFALASVLVPSLLYWIVIARTRTATEAELPVAPAFDATEARGDAEPTVPDMAPADADEPVIEGLPLQDTEADDGEIEDTDELHEAVVEHDQPIGEDVEEAIDPRFAPYRAKADRLKAARQDEVASVLFKKASAVAPTGAQARNCLFQAIACYLRAGKTADAQALASDLLADVDALSSAELFKLNAILRMPS